MFLLILVHSPVGRTESTIWTKRLSDAEGDYQRKDVLKRSWLLDRRSVTFTIIAQRIILEEDKSSGGRERCRQDQRGIGATSYPTRYL